MCSRFFCPKFWANSLLGFWMMAATGWVANEGRAQDFAAEARVEYARDVRPILADKCFACHGPDGNTRAADLRLDQFDAAVAGGAIVPEDPDSSELMVRLSLAEDDPGLMPPLSSHKQVSPAEREILRRWIQQGAAYQSHWAFAAPQRPAIPAVRQEAWVSNAIDRFVLAKLESEGMAPNPPADPATLIRRLSLDIRGLPPEPAEVQAFLQDPSPAAYEALIDQWMATPSWGEHRGRYWLDLARYADTHGIHFDNYREVWAYRDWVIEAFNRNLPFDQFTIEQLAGDLLPDATLDQQIASGYNRCNITTNEGGVIEEEYRVLYAVDRTETMAQTWLGLTVGCAVCHDHKFDPVSQVEFYQLAAFFNNTTQPVMDGNIPNTPPTVFVPQRAERDRWQAVTARLDQARQQRAQRREHVSATLDDWLREPGAAERLLGEESPRLSEGREFQIPTGPSQTVVPWFGPDQQTVAGPAANGGEGIFPWALRADRFAASPVLPGVGDLEGDQSFTLAAWIRFAGNQNSGALLSKMSDGGDYRGWDLWSEGGRVGMHLIHAWPASAVKVVTRDPLPSDQWHHVTVTYDGSQKAAGLRIYVAGVQVPVSVASDSLKASIRNDLPVVLFQRHGSRPLGQLALDDLRLYQRPMAADEVQELSQWKQVQRLRQSLAAIRPSDQPLLEGDLRELALNRYLSRLDETHQSLEAEIAGLTAEEAEIRRRGTMAHVMHERTDQTPMAFVLHRGEYDQRRQQVQANTPEVLPPLSEDLPRNRLGLAQWLVAEGHPLTARVTVNQFWQSVFGQGLVASSGDFGLMGNLPTHPELLDYLAVEFQDQGWDVRAFFKHIFLSSTYRQSAEATSDKLSRDPENLWLSRGPRFRMDAEMVRDYALAASGILSRKVGGPSVRPYQPPGVWEAVAMIGSNTRDYVAERGEGLYRRSLYTFWKRSAPPASMDVFNAPSRETCTVRRERTNTPLQALAMLNDPQMIEAARYLATQVMQVETTPVSVPAERTAEGNSPVDETWDRQVDLAVWRVLCRPLQQEERAVLRASWEHLRGYYAENPEDATALIAVGDSPVPSELDSVDLAAWTLLINQLMNLDEVINK